jgi:Na+-driven multidrug efflux pump
MFFRATIVSLVAAAASVVAQGVGEGEWEKLKQGYRALN